eukprot:15333068-Ditylum_brightwellii.AAC.1
MVCYNANLPMYDLAMLFYNTGLLDEWLKYWQNLQAVITRQNVTDAHSMYTITKSILREEALTAFKMLRETMDLKQNQTTSKQCRTCAYICSHYKHTSCRLGTCGEH